MRLKELMAGLEHLDMVVFDNEALVVFQSGPTPKEDVIIELLSVLKDGQRLELIQPDEGLVIVKGKRILVRRMGDYWVTLLADPSDSSQKIWLDMVRVHHRLMPEFPATER